MPASFQGMTSFISMDRALGLDVSYSDSYSYSYSNSFTNLLMVLLKLKGAAASHATALIASGLGGPKVCTSGLIAAEHVERIGASV